MHDRLRLLLRCVVMALSICGVWMVVSTAIVWLEALMLESLVQDRSDALVAFAMLRGAMWALFTPFALFFGYHVPIRKPHRLRNALLVLLFAVGLGALREVVGASNKQLMLGEPWNPVEIVDALKLRLDANVLIVLIMIAVANIWRMQREAVEREHRALKLEAEIVRAQLRQLRADLQPHFLFNAMNAIAALIHSDPDGADRMIVSLTGLLRRSLDLGQRQEIPLAEELALAHDYLELQRVRFGQRLDVSFRAGEDILLAMVPPLLLQPLVENAVVHGAAAHGGSARVEVVAFAESNRLRLQVRDNGPGCDPSDALAGPSIGVPNTKARLGFMYRGEHSFDMRREDDEFVVDITIPLRDASLSPSPAARGHVAQHATG